MGATASTDTKVGQPRMGWINTNCKYVITDSGGVQEESSVLNIPCFTLRENTERPITVEEGTNTIVGNKTENILDEWKNISLNGGKSGRIPELWDGKTAIRISDILVDFLKDYLSIVIFLFPLLCHITYFSECKRCMNTY